MEQQVRYNPVDSDSSGLTGSAVENSSCHHFSEKFAIQPEDDEDNILERSFHVDDRVEDPQYTPKVFYNQDGIRPTAAPHYRAKVSDGSNEPQLIYGLQGNLKISNRRNRTKRIDNEPSASLPGNSSSPNSNKEHRSEGTKLNVSASSLASEGSPFGVPEEGREDSFAVARTKVMQHRPTTLPTSEIKTPIPGSQPTKNLLNGGKHLSLSTTQTQYHLKDRAIKWQIKFEKRYAHDTSHLSEPMPYHIDYGVSDPNATDNARHARTVANSSSKIVHLPRDRLFKQDHEDLLGETQPRLGKGFRRVKKWHTKKGQHKYVELPNSILQSIKKKKEIKRAQKKGNKNFQALVSPQDVLA